MRRRYNRCLSVVIIIAIMATILPLAPAISSQAVQYGLSNPRVSEELTTWDCIYFGDYWQDDTNGDGVADQNDEKTPIKWRVLSVEGNEAFLLSDRCLDSQPYNTERTSVSWAKSSIRSWLNNIFYNNAFSEKEGGAICDKEIKNDGNTEKYTVNGDATVDKIYLLSALEIASTEYGFIDSLKNMTGTRIAYNTSYAAATEGAWNEGDDNCATWYLRTPVSYFGLIPSAVTVSYGGQGAVVDGMHSVEVVSSIRPALHVNLSDTSNWTYAGTVSSDGSSEEPANGEITVQTPLENSITTRQLFEEYPEYLYQSPQEKVLDMVFEDCAEVNGNRTWAQNVLASAKYTFSGEALETILKYDASLLGGTTIQDEYLDNATVRFLEGMSQRTDVINNVIAEVKKDYEWAKDLKSTTKDISSMEMQQLLKKSKHFNEKEIELLLKEIGANWEEIDKTFKNVGYAIEFNEAALLITTLESIEKSMIEDLLEEVKKAAPGSDVERGLTRALENVSHPYKAVVSKYLKKDCLKLIAKAVEESGETIAELVAGTGATGLIFCAESFWKIIAYVLPEASADDVISAQNDTNFFHVIDICLSKKAREFIYNRQNNGNLDMDVEIEKYKLLYHAKLVASKNASESCEKIAKGYMKNVMGNNGVLLGTFSYKKHIEGCKAKVNAMLNAKYTYKKSDDELSVSGLVESENSIQSLNRYLDEGELEETNDKTDNRVMVIPSVTEEMSVVSISDKAFEGNTEIEYLIVPEGIKEIGASAFKDCTSLKKVVLGNSVTRIGEEAFAGCSSLEVVMCPDSLQQVETNSIEGDNLTLIGSEASAIDEYARENNLSYVESEKEVKDISINKLPDNTEYSSGEVLEETGMELTITYKDGTEASVTDGWYSVISRDVNGNSKVYVTYGGVTTSYEVSILSEQGYYEVVCEDVNGANVADSLTYTGVVGDIVEVEAPVVAGYEFVGEDSKRNVVIGNEYSKVTFLYERCRENNMDSATVSMDATSFEYTGEEINPSISLSIDGKELVEGVDYEKIILNNVEVGTAVIILSGLGEYEGVFMKEYKIVSVSAPAPTISASPSPTTTPTTSDDAEIVMPIVTPSVPNASAGGDGGDTASADISSDDSQTEVSQVATLGKVKLSSAKNKKKNKAVLKWKKLSRAIGYQIQYGTNKKFKKAKVKTTGKTKYTLKKLKKKKTYYIRVRAYQVANGVKVYGKWSGVKKVKIKR